MAPIASPLHLVALPPEPGERVPSPVVSGERGTEAREPVRERRPELGPLRVDARGAMIGWMVPAVTTAVVPSDGEAVRGLRARA